MKQKNVQKHKEQKSTKGVEKQVEELHKEIEKLQQEKDKLKQEKEQTFAKLQRVSADYANYQKRIPKQIADSVAYEKEAVIKALLPVLDNFEHTLKSMQTNQTDDEHTKGVRIVYDHMLDVLKSYGVEQIRALGEIFDPAVHQAMMPRFDEDKEENIVLEEFQAGYKLNGRLIRPSKVVVNKVVTDAPKHEAPEEAAQEKQSDESE